MNNTSVFERYLEAMQNTGDILLRWKYQKDLMKTSLLDDDTINQIAARVIDQLSITMDADDLIYEIEKLHRAIEDLGR